jgi:pyruvate dehydrogenase (quinone)
LSDWANKCSPASNNFNRSPRRLKEFSRQRRRVYAATYGCELALIDFAAFAKACGADGFECTHPSEASAAIRATLHSPRTAVLEVLVDPDEKPSLPMDKSALL